MSKVMDRRTLLQLITVLSAARPAISQDRSGSSKTPPQAGRAQPAPMRITREEIASALKLMGLEFTSPEIDMMLRPVNTALASYESLRKKEIGYGVEPAFYFQPGL